MTALAVRSTVAAGVGLLWPDPLVTTLFVVMPMEGLPLAASLLAVLLEAHAVRVSRVTTPRVRVVVRFIPAASRSCEGEVMGVAGM
jgi:hypothetical protein